MEKSNKSLEVPVARLRNTSIEPKYIFSMRALQYELTSTEVA